MNSEHYEMLQDILKQCKQEANEIQIRIDENLSAIDKSDKLIEFYKNNEEYGYGIFCPRDTDVQEEDASEEKDFYQQQNQRLHQKKEMLYSNIEKLEKILSEDFSGCQEKKDKEKNLMVLSVQEEDRQRIARDLHDTALQNLTHLVHKIELSSLFIDQDPIRAKLELSVVNKTLKKTIEEIRNTIFDLRSMTFDDLGLSAAFERLLAVVNEDKQFEVEEQIDEITSNNQLVLATIYRIVQECLNNVLKHAQADKLIFYCKQKENECIIDIRDNGKGFTQEEIDCKKNRHFGISVMKERAALLGGEVLIEPEFPKGTHIHIEIPLD